MITDFPKPGDLPKPEDSGVSIRGLIGFMLILCAIGIGISVLVIKKIEPVPVGVEKLVTVTPNEYPVDRIRVIDGDTIECDILLPLGITLRQEEIRFSDYDAWESSRRRRSVKITDEELVKGKQATALFKELLETSSMTIILEGDGRDVYGRVLGRPVIYSNNGARFMLADFMLDNNMWRTTGDE